MRLALCAAVVALVATAWASGGAARPYRVTDMLRQEAFGAQVVDPSGRWLVIERMDRYDTAARYDNDLQNSTALQRLLVVDLVHPSVARPLLPNDPGPGDVIGEFSPSGRALTITRFRDHRWTLGVVTLATGTVRWFADITPEKAFFGRGLQWRSETELLVINRPDGTPTWPLRVGHVSADVLPRVWAASAAGAGAHTVFGSGAYEGERPRPTPRQLLSLEVTTGVRRTLAVGEFLDLELTPDRQAVALFESGRSVQAQADGPVQGPMGISTEATLLSVLDLASGARRSLCPGLDALPLLMSWSPDGQSLLAFARPPNRPWPSGRLLRVDRPSGACREIGAGLTPQFFLRPEELYAGWMGQDPILLAQPQGGGRFDWYRLAAAGPVNLTRALPSAPRVLRSLDAASLTAIADGTLWRADRFGRAAPLSAAPASAVHEPYFALSGRLENRPPAGSWIVFGAAASRRLQWVDGGGLHTPLSLPAGGDRVVAASAPQRRAVLRSRDAQGVEQLRLASGDGALIAVATLNADLSDVDPVIALPVRHPGPEGQTLTSWLFVPRQVSGRPPPPLVVRPYLGSAYGEAPQDLPAERGFTTNIRAMVGHGYAILVPSLPLPRDRKDPLAGVADRILAIVDAAAADPATSGVFDCQRIALWGQSYGGYTVMATISQTRRFKAAVSIAGLSDLISKWETLAPEYRVMPEEGAMFNWSMGSVEQGQDEMFRPPWSDPDRYIRNSPLFTANRIETPLLLMHGDQDPIVIQQSEAMFAALYRQDKDAMMVTYWGEGHGIGSPGNVRDMFGRIFSFLDARLGLPAKPTPAAPGPSPANTSASVAPRPRPPQGSGARWGGFPRAAGPG